MAKKQNQTAPENIEAVNVTEAFFDKYKKEIVAAVIAVFVIAACIIGWNAYSGSRNQKASEALFPCETYFGEENYDKALNGDGANCVGLLKVIDDFGSTKAGNLARLYAGICYAQTGQFEDAKTQLEKFDTQDDEMISPATIGLLGNVYANLGQNDKAVELLKKAAKRASNPSLTPTFLHGLCLRWLPQLDGRRRSSSRPHRSLRLTAKPTRLWNSTSRSRPTIPLRW